MTVEKVTDEEIVVLVGDLNAADRHLASQGVELVGTQYSSVRDIIRGAMAVLVRLRAALAQQPRHEQEVVAVKELRWVDRGRVPVEAWGDSVLRQFIGHHDLGRYAGSYCVQECEPGGSWGWWCTWTSGREPEGVEPTEAAAKLACQTDFDTRIRSVATPAPAPAPSAEVVEAAIDKMITAVGQWHIDQEPNIAGMSESLARDLMSEWHHDGRTVKECQRVIRLAAAPASETALPEDVVRLVIAARDVAYSDPIPETMRELDKAAEAFADRVPWEDEPASETEGE